MVMKKFLIVVTFSFLSFCTYASIVLPDYNNNLIIPDIGNKKQIETKNKSMTSFKFKIGNVGSDFSILGSWTIDLGVGFGFTLYPELAWLVTVPGIRSGVIFKQKRLFALDWTTISGLSLHLFFNDNIDATEFSFKYNVGKKFKSLYITNKFNGLQVNPYRELKGGKAQDINFGFNWGHKFYKGQFDIQFDSVKRVVDTFKGNKKEIQSKIYSSEYSRGIYYYLPDTNIESNIEVYVSDSDGDYFNDISTDLSDDRKYILYQENEDYKLDSQNGFIKFKQSIHNKTVLIYYKASNGGALYGVGDPNIGKNGLFGTTDFDKFSYPKYFTHHNGKDYLILSFNNEYSYFEEKNSYSIASIGAIVNNLIVDIYDENNAQITGFTTIYDDYTGRIRVMKNQAKGNQYTIYPFYDSVEPTTFYLSFYSPLSTDSKNTISYSCYISGEDLHLSSKPIETSIEVFLNSIKINSSEYTYDFISQSIILKKQISDSDIVKVSYVTDSNDQFNFTGTLKNDFRINKYLLIGDSFWYRMPIKLWDESYYFKLHSQEFLYNIKFSGDFKSLLIHPDNANLSFSLDVGLSFFYPELKGVTIIEDFEYNETGKKISLDSTNWFPIELPKSLYPDLATASYGRLFYRNMHRFGNEQDILISLQDGSVPDKEAYTNGNKIGPYSSSDGYDGQTNSLSMISEFELDANEGVSFVIPVANIGKDIDFTLFEGLTAAIKAIDLTGQVKMYIDGGKVSERFNNSETTIQTETLDEGLKYLISDAGSFYLYKGEGDGLNSTNDFNENGILDLDVSSDITKFINFDDSSDYLTITPNFKKIVTYSIKDSDKLSGLRGIRITLYSTTGASGKILFNQLRLIDTGWQYDGTTGNVATEIFPQEDAFLENHIFSVENSDFDKSIHFQRSKERTLRINLKQGQPFAINKKYSSPIDITNFKNMGLFFITENNTSRQFKLTLKDTNGNTMSATTNLASYTSAKWHKLQYSFNNFVNHSNFNNYISEISISLEDASSDIMNNTIYIDEIYMKDPNAFVGFSTTGNFLYSEPNLQLKNKNGFIIFNSPYVGIKTSFNTSNFVLSEMNRTLNHLFKNDFTTSFSLVGIKFFMHSFFDLVFQENSVYNSNEELKIKFNRLATQKVPLFFTLSTDYNKIGATSTFDKINAITNNQERTLSMELGVNYAQFGKLSTTYNIETKSSSYTQTNSTIKLNSSINFNNTLFEIEYSIFNQKKYGLSPALFSFHSIGYLFGPDFISFGDNGEKKEQDFSASLSFYVIPSFIYLTFKSNFLNSSKISSISNKYDFSTTLNNEFNLSLYVSNKNKKQTFFKINQKREINIDYLKDFPIIYWNNYFSEFPTSLNNITILALFPPFSSIYYHDNRRAFGENTKFNSLKDSLSLTWDWLVYFEKTNFAPSKFIVSIIENLVNTVVYTPSYSLNFELSGQGGIITNYLKFIDIQYSISDNLTIKENNYSNSTKLDLNLDFYFFNGISLNTFSSYLASYSYSFSRNELSHTIVLSTQIIKNFYKNNLVTNDKYGVEIDILLEMKSLFYQRFDKISDKSDNPFSLSLKPKIGYRFNKNISLYGNINMAYSIDYSQSTKKFIHRFGMEIYLEGVLSF